MHESDLLGSLLPYTRAKLEGSKGLKEQDRGESKTQKD